MSLSQDAITKILKTLEGRYPRAGTALTHKNPFEMLIATILSAQCTDKRVNTVTQVLFKKCRTPHDFVRLGKGNLERSIKTCGLYHTKAKNIVAACRMILNDYEGQVPQGREALMKLPGVGRKTANVVLSNAFGIPAIAVDTHVFRVSHRLGLVKARNPEETEKQLMEVIPRRQWSRAHHWLIHHGRALCHARKPNCLECPVRQWCQDFNERFPIKKSPGSIAQPGA
ncbi:MAG: endonuclease III [Deltaproteobacteria bacterium RIFCSPLOWO2_02_FULL_50_16]|nr:MAG: endonuclease III [Deltaproteobacteria bacterium RIFCSPLOWO2_02_FULL_50_16]OGQ66335.1 MAG: endonuclease III [Deltaproteobacteria bacterium RIFCSPLOWO2_12_FULL_50_11]